MDNSFNIRSEEELTLSSESNRYRTVYKLEKGWKFRKGDLPTNPESLIFDDSDWENISIPHDWAITGPFDKNNDIQNVAILENTEEIPSVKTGRTGGLPHTGIGWYRYKFEVENMPLSSKRILLQFDGAMSNSQVYINGKKAPSHPYGYSYFYLDITALIIDGENVIAVRLENYEQSSRWYPGAGLYRNVMLIEEPAEGFKKWGTFITTPKVSKETASIRIQAELECRDSGDLELHTTIIDSRNMKSLSAVSDTCISSYPESTQTMEQLINIPSPDLWSPENPYLYTAVMSLYKNGIEVDKQEVRFGIRSIKFSAEKGFELNGNVRKFKGVCIHHDLGPLGAAVNEAAVKRQLILMKDMGCDSIRSSHNMPTPQMLDLCDETGFMFMAESFDEWKTPKMKNGYNLLFDDWAEKDIVNLCRRVRNHPCVVMYSCGNEIPDQLTPDGKKLAVFLQDLFHREDPTRPVTVGMDQVQSVMDSGFGASIELPGLNYRVHLYDEAYNKFPQKLILGSETASTVSSRGIYKFPAVEGKMVMHDDLQCSSYDLESCSWSNIPDEDFAHSDDKPYLIGQFVWTGFDYLGEPTPYDDPWPSRSSYFGICDLGGIPKDRYYLYRSVWNTKSPTIHILPHWNWEGREGKVTPVFVYTSYESAELFINGKSQGVRTKDKTLKLERYRLTWMESVYEAGEIKAVAYDKNGKAAAEKVIRTAGPVSGLKLETDRAVIKADGKDICFITVSALDRDGNFSPLAENSLLFNVSGEGSFKAACNGNAASLELFHKPQMKLFSGKLVVLIQSKERCGKIQLDVSGEGLETASIIIKSL